MRATSDGHALYPTVKSAFQSAGIQHKPNDPSAVLFWCDALYKLPPYDSLGAAQVINRIPGMEILCCKSTLARLIQAISPRYPKLYTFMPKSWILSKQKSDFLKQFVKRDRAYIVKPDNGSLGIGIQVFRPAMHFSWGPVRAVAQEYIDTYLLDRRKFDFRIYVLVASVDPLQIYVYREGIARFCSEDTGSGSDCSQLTNTAVNRGHAPTIGSILQMLTSVFARLQEAGVDTEQLWREIDEAIVLTIIAGVFEIETAVTAKLPSTVYPRCFQVVGFDVMLDKNAKPAVLEVNYRPSLEVDDGENEGPLKIAMLADAMRIAVPLPEVQLRGPIAADFQARFWAARRAAEQAGRFECVFDSRDGCEMWRRVMRTVKEQGSYEKAGWSDARGYFAMRPAPIGRLAISTHG
jgi:hypothetical protein